MKVCVFLSLDMEPSFPYTFLNWGSRLRFDINFLMIFPLYLKFTDHYNKCSWFVIMRFVEVVFEISF